MKTVIEFLTRGLDYPRFHDIYFSDELKQELVHAANIKERTVKEHVQLPDGRVQTKVYIAPRVVLPSAIARLVEGYVIGYEEHSIFDPVARRVDMQIVTPRSDLVHIAASKQFLYDPVGTRTRIDLDVNVKIFGIGSMIERFMISETRSRYENVERVLQQFADRKSNLAGASAQECPVDRMT